MPQHPFRTKINSVANLIHTEMVSQNQKILEWLSWLKPVFPEAVDLALKTRNFKFEYTHLYSDLERNKLAESDPKDVNRLLIHLLQYSGDSTNQGMYLKPLYDQLVSALGESEVRELRNILIGLRLK